MMRTVTGLSRRFLHLGVLVGVFLVLASPAPSRGQQDVPLNMRRLSDRVLVTWACDHFQGTNMAVITTDRGLVVIDTGLSPTTVSGQRKLVEEELGRSDFRFLINTHMHNDHAFANQVFPEATVVGPEGGEGSLRREIELMPELLERLKGGLESYAEWAEETSPDSVDGKHAREAVAAFTAGIADLEAGIRPAFPTLTFKDRHTMHMGDLRLELFEFQGLHSDSDIMVLVPEERILFTGDIFWGGQLPLLRAEARAEFERLLHHWDSILEISPDLETIVPGHSDVPLSVEQFRGMHLYLSRLWADVRAAREADTPLLRFLMGNVFTERYPEVADFSFIRGDYNLHQHNIYVLWELMGE